MVGSTHLKSGTPTHPNDTAVAFGVFQTMHKKSSGGPNPNERPVLGTQNDNNFYNHPRWLKIHPNASEPHPT